MTTLKNISRISVLMALVVMFVFAAVAPVAAQEMSKDEWQSQMSTLTAKRADLQAQLAKVTGEVAAMKVQSDKLDADLRACEDALYALLGVTRSDVEAFDKELSDMEKRVAELQRMSDAQLVGQRSEIEAMNSRLAEMAKSNIALIPRYGARVKSLQDNVWALMKSLQREKTYTVGSWSQNRDCLWNIAKKKDIYDNAWLWPKIWQGNRDKIKDPDVIQPSWVLKIPEGKELSGAEKSAANSYYHKKAASPDGN